MTYNSKETKSKELFLLFSKNGNLTRWKNSGYLQREEKYYQNLNKLFGKITWITFGGEEESNLIETLNNIDVLNNSSNLSINESIENIATKLKQSIHVLKTNQLSSAYIAYKIHKITNIPYIIRCGNVRNYWIHRKSFIEKIINWLQLKLSISAARALIVPTQQEANYAKRLFFLNSSKIKIIPNFVDTELFKPSNPVKTNKICFVGSFKPAKNLTNLVLSLKNLNNVELRLIGDGQEKQKLKTLAKQIGVKIEFIGVQPNEHLPKLLNESQCFVFPSLYEGHPKALIEAMACGLPVITTPVYGIKNIIQHEFNGYICNNITPESIRVGITKVMNDAKLRNFMSKNARQTILNEYSLEVVLAKEIQLYKDLKLS